MKRITLWVAKDKGSKLSYLFLKKPVEEMNIFYSSNSSIKVSKNLFPKLTYTNSPKKINLLIEDEEKIIEFHEHLVDLVEELRLNENYPELCDLETEFIELFGEEIFQEHYQSH